MAPETVEVLCIVLVVVDEVSVVPNTDVVIVAAAFVAAVFVVAVTLM